MPMTAAESSIRSAPTFSAESMRDDGVMPDKTVKSCFTGEVRAVADGVPDGPKEQVTGARTCEADREQR